MYEDGNWDKVGEDSYDGSVDENGNDNGYEDGNYDNVDEDGENDEVEENGNDNVDEEDNDDNSGWTEFENEVKFQEIML